MLENRWTSLHSHLDFCPGRFEMHNLHVDPSRSTLSVLCAALLVLYADVPLSNIADLTSLSAYFGCSSVGGGVKHGEIMLFLTSLGG